MEMKSAKNGAKELKHSLKKKKAELKKCKSKVITTYKESKEFNNKLNLYANQTLKAAFDLCLSKVQAKYPDLDFSYITPKLPVEMEAKAQGGDLEGEVETRAEGADDGATQGEAQVEAEARVAMEDRRFKP